MTTSAEISHQQRVRLLDLAKEIGNISATTATSCAAENPNNSSTTTTETAHHDH
jgi:hypothetical protein